MVPLPREISENYISTEVGITSKTDRGPPPSGEETLLLFITHLFGGSAAPCLDLVSEFFRRLQVMPNKIDRDVPLVCTLP